MTLVPVLPLDWKSVEHKKRSDLICDEYFSTSYNKKTSNYGELTGPGATSGGV